MAAVDTHSHVFIRGLPLAPVRRYVPEYDATVEAYLGELDANGISHGVLVQPSFLGTDNSFMIQMIRRHPDRLRGIAVLEPTVPAEECGRLASEGIVGIRLNLDSLPIPDFAREPWPRLLRTVADLGWQVEVHREARDLAHIIGPLLAAGQKVVVDHFGRPEAEQGVEDPGFQYLLSTGKSRQVWVKLSGAYRNGKDGRGEKNSQDAARLLLDAFGPDRLVWGSDWPHTRYEKVVTVKAARRSLDGWVPDEAQRRTILGRTALELFGFA